MINSFVTREGTMTPGEELWQLELENEGLEEGATRKNNKLCQNFHADVGRSHHEGRKT